MNDLTKAMEILKQINALPLDETPVFTWDDQVKANDKEWKEGYKCGIALGLCIAMVVLLILSLFGVIK